MELHEWTTHLLAELGLDGEIDERLVLDVAREAAHNVLRPAAPLTTFVLGHAAARAGGRPEDVDRIAARIGDLAAAWGRRKQAADAPAGEA